MINGSIAELFFYRHRKEGIIANIKLDGISRGAAAVATGASRADAFYSNAVDLSRYVEVCRCNGALVESSNCYR